MSLIHGEFKGSMPHEITTLEVLSKRILGPTLFHLVSAEGGGVAVCCQVPKYRQSLQLMNHTAFFQ